MNNNTTKIVGASIIVCLLSLNLAATSQITTLENEIDEVNKSNKQITEQLEKSEEGINKLKKEIEELKAERWLYKGDFSVTGYCNCPSCNGKWAYGPTKSGTMPAQGRTIAVDPTVIPLGTEVVIDNHVFIAEDTGSAIKGNKIDIYFDEHEDAQKFGKKQKEVFW